MHSSILVVLSLLLLALKVTNADPGVINQLIGSASNALSPLKAQKLATVAELTSSSVASPNYPTYPQATDYASGTCVGYAFCFASWNPPLLTEPDVMCPAGYEVTTNFGKPFCVQRTGVCPGGYDLSSNGNCCMVKQTSSCYPTWDSCDGDSSSSSGNMISGMLQNIGSICKGSPAYSSIVDNVQLVEVTKGSRWYDGTTAGSTGTTGTTGMAGSTGTTVMTGSNITVVDPNAEVQVVPAGSLVNIGGRLVRVGPSPDAGSSSSSSSGGGGGSSSAGSGGAAAGGSPAIAPAPGMTPQQQAALAALQAQAQQQGTLTPSTAAAGAGSGVGGGTATMPTQQQAALAALQSQATQQGTFVAPQGGSAPAGPGALNQQAALNALQAQAQQQGTFIPTQTDGTGATGNGAGVVQIAPPGINPTLPPPTIAPGTPLPGSSATARFASKNIKPNVKPNLKASNARKKADPTATEPWLPDIFGGSRRLTAAAGEYDSADTAAMAAAAAAHAAQHAAPGVGGKAGGGAGSNKEALFLLPMLMMLPRLSLGGKPVAGSDIMAAKEVVMSQVTSKADVVPRCFSKCCSSDADVVCVAAKQTVNYAKPSFVCPTGCSYASATGKCICRPGSFSACQPTETVCSWGDQPICAGSSEFFGIDACKFIGALQKHLPKVQCPV